MTRAEALQIKIQDQFGITYSLENLINKIYDDFEHDLQIASSDKTCDGCINKPLPKENYPEVCGTCSRWYSDNYEEKIDA